MSDELNKKLLNEVLFGSNEDIKAILDEGANINFKMKNSNTVLLEAARLKWGYRTTKLLLDCGANINAQNNHGVTALMIATRSGSIETVQLLLERGADVDLKNSSGYTALMLAKNDNRLHAIALIDNFIESRTLSGVIMAEEVWQHGVNF